MNLHNYERTSDFEVEEWLIKKLDLSKDQIYKMRESEMIRFSKIKFYKRIKPKNKSILIRLSALFFLPVLIIVMLTLPVNYLFTGNWGYSTETLNWFNKWHSAIF